MSGSGCAHGRPGSPSRRGPARAAAGRSIDSCPGRHAMSRDGCLRVMGGASPSPEAQRLPHGAAPDTKVIVVMPAYNAGRTLRLTYEQLPKDQVSLVILVDARAEGRVRQSRAARNPVVPSRLRDPPRRDRPWLRVVSGRRPTGRAVSPSPVVPAGI